MRITIIGGQGKMGSCFSKAFTSLGHNVIVSDRSTNISNVDAVKDADIVIVSVPIRSTQEVIEEILPHLREDTILTDFTSVKVKPLQNMKNAPCNVVGGHPLFGPSSDLKKQNFILCPIKGGYEEYKKILESIGLQVIVMSGEEHDKLMSMVQCLTHLSNLSLVYALEKIGINIEDTFNVASPVYLLRLMIAGRMLAQDASLYSDIQEENVFSKDAAKVYLKVVEELVNSDREEFEKIFEKTKQKMGDFAQKSLKVTNEILKVMPNE